MSLETKQYEPIPLPALYLVEMVMDRIAACKVYRGKDYTDASPLEYLNRSREKDLMHPDTLEKLRYLLTMLQEQGEKATFRFIRSEVLRNWNT